jgi:hypothetical protein
MIWRPRCTTTSTVVRNGDWMDSTAFWKIDAVIRDSVRYCNVSTYICYITTGKMRWFAYQFSSSENLLLGLPDLFCRGDAKRHGEPVLWDGLRCHAPCILLLLNIRRSKSTYGSYEIRVFDQSFHELKHSCPAICPRQIEWFRLWRTTHSDVLATVLGGMYLSRVDRVTDPRRWR